MKPKPGTQSACKHDYNDILTNMQTITTSITHKSSERRRKHGAQCTALLCVDQRHRTITMRTPATAGTDWHSPLLCVSPLAPLAPLAECWLSYFKWKSRAEPSWAAHRLLPSRLSHWVWLVSTCRLCSELWLNNTAPPTITSSRLLTLYQAEINRKYFGNIFRFLKYFLTRNIYFLWLGGYAGEVTRLARTVWLVQSAATQLLLIFCLLPCPQHCNHPHPPHPTRLLQFLSTSSALLLLLLEN